MRKSFLTKILFLILAALVSGASVYVQAQSCCDKHGLKDLPGVLSLYLPAPLVPYNTLYGQTVSTAGTVDATGEMFAQCGKINFSAGAGSKTCSSSGCKINLRIGAVTWSNTSSNIIVGLQDMAVAGPPVQPDEVWTNEPRLSFNPIGGATPLALTANATNEFTISAGSRTLTYGAPVCVVTDFVNRAGSDSVIISHITTGSSATTLPSQSLKTSGSWNTAGGMIFGVKITADDGTLVWLDSSMPFTTSVSTVITSTGIDEMGNAIRMPVDCKITKTYSSSALTNSSSDYNISLYDLGGSATGTPTLLKDINGSNAEYTVDANQAADANIRIRNDLLPSPIYVKKGQWIGVTLTVLSANSVTFNSYTAASAAERAILTGDSHKISRDHGTDAVFTAGTSDILPIGVVCDGVQTNS